MYYNCTQAQAPGVLIDFQHWGYNLYFCMLSRMFAGFRGYILTQYPENVNYSGGCNHPTPCLGTHMCTVYPVLICCILQLSAEQRVVFQQRLAELQLQQQQLAQIQQQQQQQQVQQQPKPTPTLAFPTNPTPITIDDSPSKTADR